MVVEVLRQRVREEVVKFFNVLVYNFYSVIRVVIFG